MHEENIPTDEQLSAIEVNAEGAPDDYEEE